MCSSCCCRQTTYWSRPTSLWGPLEQLTEGKNISATQFSLGEQSSTAFFRQYIAIFQTHIFWRFHWLSAIFWIFFSAPFLYKKSLELLTICLLWDNFVKKTFCFWRCIWSLFWGPQPPLYYFIPKTILWGSNLKNLDTDL